MRYSLLLTGILFIIPLLSVQAASSNFIVKAFIGSDQVPPTTPTLTNVIPVSINQINIDWTASTDNVFLAGYRVFRDGFQIATTTQTNFNDVGLNSSTTYSYNVDAFDSFENFSTSSAIIATTTLSIPVIPPTTTTTNATAPKKPITSTLIPPTLLYFNIIPEKNSVKIDWKTNYATRYDLSWGRTESYELGTISSNEFRSDNETIITDLEPGTTYLYQLKAVNGLGFSKIISVGEFSTLLPFPITLTPNVSDLSVSVENNDVFLNWKNKDLPENYRIRVVRSYLFYPLNTQDGAVIYDGDGNTVKDADALKERAPQYYTVFVYNKFGLVSSGAVGRADKIIAVNKTIPIYENSTTTPEKVPNIIPDNILQIEDITVTQSSTTQSFSPDLILKTNVPFLISLPSSKIPKNIKSIVVSLQDPTNNHIYNSYLLKLNKNRDAYEAVIASLGISGNSKIQVGVFDFYDIKVLTFFGSASFVDEEIKPIIFPDTIISLGTKVILISCEILFLAFFCWLFFFLRRRKSEDN